MRAILSLFAVLLFATPALAQVTVDDVDAAIDKAEQVYKSDCMQSGIKHGGIIAAAKKKAKAACANLQGCKKQCRGAKKTAKKAVRANKKDCKRACKGKAKRQCKKACRKTARPARKNARQAKRGCVKACRAKHKTPACKQARMGVLKSLGTAAASLFKNENCRDQVAEASEAIKKADKAEETAQD
jgi:hypothetical protein